MKYEELMTLAKQGRGRAYAPYSGFSVGAALLCSDGGVYTGSNIENSAFSPSVCAERVAVFSAVHDGKREFLAIAISGGDCGKEPSGFTPCGVCRQVLSEFSDGNLTVLVAKADGYDRYLLSELIPHSFGL